MSIYFKIKLKMLCLDAEITINMKEIYQRIVAKFPLTKQNEPLARYSSFLIGGNADLFFTAESERDLRQIIEFTEENKVKYAILGGGTNVLFMDEGFRGLVIHLKLEDFSVNGIEITVGAGVKIAKLIKEVEKNDLFGFERWFGLPGTVGGAVRGNAGCNGLETSEVLLSARVLAPKSGEIKSVSKDYFEFGYRDSVIKRNGEIVLEATFLAKKPKDISEKERDKIKKDIQEFRLTKQPFGKSSGSFFKNPSKTQPAGLLIDKAGLKGTAIGGAKISEKHGNFILNTGGATSKDVIELANLAKQRVFKKFGVVLEEEVQIIGG